MKRIWLIAPIGIIANALVSCGGDKEEVKTYFTVTFDAGGGTPVPEAQRVEAGKTAAAPATAPAKQGYLFVCWSADGTKAYDFLTPVTRDLTLRAKWQEEAVAEYWQVTWELGGGAWPAEGDNHATQVLKGGTLAEPAPPVKATGSAGSIEGFSSIELKDCKITKPENAEYAGGTVTVAGKTVSGEVTIR